MIFYCAFKAHAASMSCKVNISGGGISEEGVGSCSGLDFSFRSSTVANFWINPNGQTIDDIIWIEGCSAPRGAMACSTLIKANTGILNTSAVLLFPDGTFQVVSATAEYESGS